MESTKEIDSYFPEALRERVLNFVQFNRTSRMDDLGTCNIQRRTNFSLTQYVRSESSIRSMPGSPHPLERLY